MTDRHSEINPPPDPLTEIRSRLADLDARVRELESERFRREEAALEKWEREEP